MRLPFSESLGIHPQDSLFLEREVWDLEGTPASQRPLLLQGDAGVGKTALATALA